MIVRGEEQIYFYNLTLKRQTNYTHSCIGYFVDPSTSNALDVLTSGKNRNQPKKKAHLQLCLATESHIELFDVSEGSFKLLANIPIFAIITQLKSFTLQNKNESFIAITSDSGVLTIARFINQNGQIKLQTLHNQPLTRSGIRRMSPIYHMSVDPYGRCLLLSAMEKNKLCFLLDFQNDKFEISSPLEINRPEMITLQEVECDMLFNNPCFASIEIDTANNNDHHLVFYMLDLGLNHIIKKSDYKIRPTANFLMSLPELSKYGIRTLLKEEEDDADENINPFVVIGFENFIIIKDMNGFYSLKVQIPRRENQKGVVNIIACSIQKLKKDFFILLQTNHGDLLKLTVTSDKSDRNRPVASISYFDTTNQSESLHIFKNGYLFSNSEYGDKYLFQFESLGKNNSVSNSCSSKNSEQSLNFTPSESLVNLSITTSLKCLNPTRKNIISNSLPLTITSQSNNRLLSLKSSAVFHSLISTSLSRDVQKLWPIRDLKSKTHKLLFLGYTNTTTILNVENDSIEELNLENNPFLLSGDKTILVQLIGYKSIIQICENEMRQVIIDSENNCELKLQWYPPAGIKITSASCTSTQIALALSNFEIAYFEINQLSSNESLNELQRRIEMDETINCLSFDNSFRSKYLAVACQDTTVKIISVSSKVPEEFLEVVSMQTLMAPVSDIRLIKSNLLQLHIGLSNGLYVTSKISSSDAQISDTRTKYVGPNEVNLSVISSLNPDFDLDADDDVSSSDDESEDEDPDNNKKGSEGELNDDISKSSSITGVVVHNTTCWISYNLDSFNYIRPISSTSVFDLITMDNFVTNGIEKNGCCGLTSTGELVIGQLHKFPTIKNWFNYNMMDKLDIERNDSKIKQNNNILDHASDNDDEDDEDDDTILESRTYFTCATLEYLEDTDIKILVSQHVDNDDCIVSIINNESVFSCSETSKKFAILGKVQCLAATVVKFSTNDYHLLISTTDMKILTYHLKLSVSNKSNKYSFSIKYIHETLTGDRVHSMTAFDNMVLVPVFGNLILYDLGKKQLLKKSITTTPPSITKVTVIKQWDNKRVVVGDIRESVTMFLFIKQKNQFHQIADDVSKRAVTSMEFLDESTVIGGDKFGNIWTLRLSNNDNQALNTTTEENWGLMKRSLSKKLPNIYECPFKFELINHYFVNDIILNFHIVTSTLLADRPIIIYTGLQGTVGCLISLVSKNQVASLISVEKTLEEMDDLFFLKQEEQREQKLMIHDEETTDDTDITISSSTRLDKDKIPEGAYSIVQRNHKSYRSYYAPVKNVIDGDLCESYLKLNSTEQLYLAKYIKKLNSDDIIRLLNEFRTNCI